MKSGGLSWIYAVPALPFYLAGLHWLSSRARTVDDYLRIAYHYRCRSLSFRPVQVKSEITALLEMLSREPPRSVLEIGTARGGTLFLLAQVAAPGARLVSVDLPPGRAAVSHPRWRRVLYRGFGRRGTAIRLLAADSQLPATRERVRELVGGEPLDFLLIDGDHRYDGVKRDWELYSPMVRSGGLVAFHDIVSGPSHRVGDVPRFWAEIRDMLPGQCQELVESWDQEGFGLGVVRIP